MQTLKNARTDAKNTSPVMQKRTEANFSTSGIAFQEGSPVDILLFGFKKDKQGNNPGSSFGRNTDSDQSTVGNHVVPALRHLLRELEYTTFDISTIGPDGNRIYSMENVESQGGFSKMKQSA